MTRCTRTSSRSATTVTFRIFSNCKFPYFRLFFSLENADEIRADVARQHRAILEPLLAGKWREAQRALSRHLRYSHPLLLEAIATLRAASSDEVAGKIQSMLADRMPLPPGPSSQQGGQPATIRTVVRGRLPKSISTEEPIGPAT